MLKTLNLKITVITLLVSLLFVSGCGVKLEQERVHTFMQELYKIRKSGNLHRELRLYAKEEFKIVPYEEVENSMQANLARAGNLTAIKHLHTKKSRRNQIGEGLVNYLVATYEVTYTNMTLLESYFFLASKEKPTLVYMTLQL